ncbi:hypothetical protein [Agreia sp. COWG]|uniref:hypothetical protein n=1 Tax=Agreia sp. COWG TaxID=2773266 RepID=UPI00192668AF|nr:hypothetical protein [Agreia sp. COWG]CAD5994453.1 conserved exported protein of unknown function [Agreia sp. COWG]CAD6010862.1 conserved exported protein of unknown function [Agreia sp. COWG]
MRKIENITRKAVTAAVVVLGSVGLALGAPMAAQAQTGYRVCAAYNSNNGSGLGTGILMKVKKGDESACGSASAVMHNYYNQAYKGSFDTVETGQLTCEDFASGIGDKNDPCYQLTPGKFYKYTSLHDKLYPSAPSYTPWQPVIQK